MASGKQFFLRLGADRTVGPHTLESIRWWLGIGVIGEAWEICGQDQVWIKVTDFPKIRDYSKQQRERLERREQNPPESDDSKRALKDQVEQLNFLAVPFDAKGLKRGRAAELIREIRRMDRARAEAFDNSPATEEQVAKLIALGREHQGLTRKQAKESIEWGEADYELQKEIEKDAEEERKYEEDLIIEDILQNVNDADDWREEFNYRKISKAQARQIMEHLLREKHAQGPGALDYTRFELCELVPRLFPEKVKQPRQKREPRKAKSGCFFVFLLLFGSAFLAYFLR